MLGESFGNAGVGGRYGNGNQRWCFVHAIDVHYDIGGNDCAPTTGYTAGLLHGLTEHSNIIGIVFRYFIGKKTVPLLLMFKSLLPLLRNTSVPESPETLAPTLNLGISGMSLVMFNR